MPILKIEFEHDKDSPVEMGKGSTTQITITDEEAKKIYLDFIGQRIMKKSDKVEDTNIKYGGLTITMKEFDLKDVPFDTMCAKSMAESRIRGGKASTRARRKKT